VFIGQLQAASTAITLNSASQCILVESSWTPADNEQAIYRLRRGLQKSKVHVRIASLANSIDEAIQSVLARKTRALLELHED
jgi:SNF2 family DNA or RNA helicase